jgi:hypothetical protein
MAKLNNHIITACGPVEPVNWLIRDNLEITLPAYRYNLYVTLRLPTQNYLLMAPAWRAARPQLFEKLDGSSTCCLALASMPGRYS